MTPNDPILASQIQRDEGRKAVVYKDSKGWWTIGDGILVDFRVDGAGLRPEEMDFILANRLHLAASAATKIYGPADWLKLDAPRRRALINLCYNMGPTEFAKFQRTMGYMKAGQYEEAAANLLKNKWAKDVGPMRSKRIAQQIATGVDPK